MLCRFDDIFFWRYASAMLMFFTPPCRVFMPCHDIDFRAAAIAADTLALMRCCCHARYAADAAILRHAAIDAAIRHDIAAAAYAFFFFFFLPRRQANFSARHAAPCYAMRFDVYAVLLALLRHGFYGDVLRHISYAIFFAAVILATILRRHVMALF